MTTLTEPRSGTTSSQRPDSEPSGSRLARWRASWRVALRMARRDLRRHRGRSILVFLMVAVPVGLLAAAATVGATEQTDAADLVTARMGPGQALVQGPVEGRVLQTPDPNQGGMSWGSDNPAVAIPGYAADASLAANAEAIGRLVGGRAVPVAETEVRLVKGDRRIRVSGLVVDPRSVDLGAKARLTSGAWGTDATQIVVTPAGVAHGLPTSGTTVLSTDGTELTVTVVGTAEALSEWGGRPDFVVPALPEGAGQSFNGNGQFGWVVLGDDPVTWAEVQTLNTHGLTVYSRAVLQDPPPDSQIPAELRPQGDFTQDTGRMIAVIGGVMLFLITTLLVGPAFAVSASRQRRTLAVAATNGAEVRQLRRTVLAQAVLLGVISAVGGVALGVAAVRVGLWWWVHTHPSTRFASVPVDIPWTAFAILLPCAVLSAVVAALLPSLRLGRLDIIGVMRGQSVSPPLNKVVPVVGLVVAVAGGFVVLSTAISGGNEVQVALGAIALVLGTLLLVPALLVLFGRLASRLPVAPRMATRDAARHRTRSTPTVAAILAGVTALTAFSIGLASDTAQQMATYQAQALPGEGLVWTGDAEARLSTAAALRQAPELEQTPYFAVRPPQDPMTGPTGAGGARPVPFVSVLPSGCTAIQTLPSNAESPCQKMGTTAYDRGQIGVLPVAEIARLLRLDEAQTKVVADGGIAVALEALAREPSLQVVSGTFVMDEANYVAKDVVQTSSESMPVIAVPVDRMRDGSIPGQAGALVAQTTAQRLGWPMQQDQVLLRDPSGSISADTEKRLDELVGSEGGVYVERGFQRYDQTAMRIMMGVAALLILVVTLISTALSMAEQQADLGTLAAVGATRGTRRGFAASQAMVVGFVGAVLGIAVGLVPGIAISYPLTRNDSYDPVTGVETAIGPYLEIPWTPLLLVVLGVPLLAGLLSAAAIRKAPTMSRRAD